MSSPEAGAEPRTRTRSPLLLAVLVAVAGSGTMVVELSAVRLLAPWFGASAAVWTNVIGVVLCALALGYLIGARLSAGKDPEKALALVLSGGAVSTLLLPVAAPFVGEWFLGPSDLALEQSTRLFAWGSLASSLCLFTPAALFLGCVGPLAVELMQRMGVQHAGTAGGRVLFASTLGSLVGTFATTHLLLPELGLAKTFLLAGGAIAACALINLLARRAWRSERTLTLLLLLGLAASGAFAAGAELRLPRPAQGTILARSESPYQSLTVIERTTYDGSSKERLLQVNEGLDSFQSVWSETPGLLQAGYYYNYFAPPLAFRLEQEGGPAQPRVAVVGFGAGTVWRVLDGLFGGAPRAPFLAGIEIDSEVIELGYEWFDLPRDEPRLTVLAGRDGRAALRDLDPGFDLVVLDAYANQSEIPAHLSTLEFFSEVRAKLAPGGYLAANVGGFGLDDPVVEALAETLAAGFKSRVLALRLPFSRNVALWVVKEEEGHRLATPLDPEWRVIRGEHAADLSKLLEPVSLPGTWRIFEFDEESSALTDDRNPIERLQHDSLTRGFPLDDEAAP